MRSQTNPDDVDKLWTNETADKDDWGDHGVRRQFLTDSWMENRKY